MKKNFRNFSTMFIITLTLTVFFTGCNTSDKKAVDENIPRTEKGLTTNQPNDLTGDRNITNSDTNTMDDNNLNSQNMSDNSMIERSKNLATKLADLDKVNSANVLITGNTALVGIDIPKDSNDESITQIKDNVQNKVKELDKDINNVVVTADADLITRIKGLGAEIESGKPISGLGKEIEEIIKRITPNM